jgi:hypothetical protein
MGGLTLGSEQGPVFQVPKTKSVKAHPVAGLARVNITFRKVTPVTHVTAA